MAERRTVLFTGHVQGVGFRYTARRLASHHPVSGYVRNLATGQVELVVEAEPEAIDRFVSDVRRSMGDSITKVQSSTGPAQGEFQGFEIRH